MSTPSYPPAETKVDPFQQPGYPPQQGPPAGYPPQQGYAYPPQPYPNEYPPPQPGYPSYGYPPQQQPLSQHKDAPPSYNEVAPPPQQMQQTSANVVVVQQPMPTVYATTVRPTSDNYLTLSIVLTILCIMCCSYYGLLCTIPALIFAMNARDAQARGDNVTATSHSRISLCLNITAISVWVFFTVIVVVSWISAAASSSSSGSSCYRYYYSYYNNYYNSYTYTYSC